jgi:ABC-type nitrate/sulfonate/bicarbonate transport system ATPase subunit
LTLQQEVLALWEQSDNSVVFVTHDVEEAILLSDRVLVLGPSPGTVISEHPVPFRRPRPASLTLEEDFLQFKREIWADLGLETQGWFATL